MHQAIGFGGEFGKSKLAIKSRMDTYTAYQIYIGEIDTSKCYRVYIYYDGDDIPLYVGKSNNVCRRLDQHFKDGSDLAVVLYIHSPESKMWRAQLYTDEDCNYAPGVFELEMIRKLQPSLNKEHNSDPKKSRFKIDILNYELEVGIPPRFGFNKIATS